MIDSTILLEIRNSSVFTLSRSGHVTQNLTVKYQRRVDIGWADFANDSKVRGAELLFNLGNVQRRESTCRLRPRRSFPLDHAV